MALLAKQTLFSLYLIYVTQEEIYIRRISSGEEIKAELDLKRNSNDMFAWDDVFHCRH